MRRGVLGSSLGSHDMPSLKLWQQKMSPDIAKYPCRGKERAKLLWLEKHCPEDTKQTFSLLKSNISESVGHSGVSYSLWPLGLYLTRLLCPWNFPGKNTGVGCHVLLRGSSQPRDRTWVFCITGRFFTTEPSGKPLLYEEWHKALLNSMTCSAM